MKKFFLLALTGLLLAGCSWLERPANIKILGVGTIENDNGLFVVQIGSTKYAPDAVYTNASTRDGKVKMRPIEGMSVTAFTVHNSPKVEFIVGHPDRQYLEEYFSADYSVGLVTGIIIFIVVIGFNWIIDKAGNKLESLETQKKKA